VAWETLDDPTVPEPLLAPLQALHAALKPAATSRPIGQPREGTKQVRVLAMLRRPEGASGLQIAAAVGWAPHTVRGFLAGLAKKASRSKFSSVSARSGRTRWRQGSDTFIALRMGPDQRSPPRVYPRFCCTKFLAASGRHHRCRHHLWQCPR
jgi:hypothetical protein